MTSFDQWAAISPKTTRCASDLFDDYLIPHNASCLCACKKAQPKAGLLNTICKSYSDSIQDSLQEARAENVNSGM